MHLRRKLVPAVAAFLFLGFMAAATHAQPAQALPVDDPLVDLAIVDKSILVELRYATTRNIAGKPLYPAGARCLVRRRVAESLKIAQAWLRLYGCRLKIWDAYRPPSAQQTLWDLSKNRAFVSSPENGHSLHTWGVAVDATLVDATWKELKMPTDFDEFSPAAALRYRGGDPIIARNLGILQGAMARGGFIGMRTEWWHFIGKDWREGAQVQVDSLLPGRDGRWSAAPQQSTESAIGTAGPGSRGVTSRRAPQRH
jgi:D-alanyl-D-alanine dipeptidase